MGTSEIELLGHVYSTLRDYAPLIAKIMDIDTGKARVKDIHNMPTAYPMPYVALGGHQYIPERTFGKDGHNIVFTLDLWSDYHGRLEVLEVHDLVYEALNDVAFNTANFRCIGGCTPEQGILQPDNSTGIDLMHYISSWRARMQRL